MEGPRRRGAPRWSEQIGGLGAAEDVLVYFDGASRRPCPAPEHVEVRFATRRGRDAADDDIAAFVAAHDDPGACAW